MKKEQTVRVIEEEFSKTLCGGLKREAIEFHNGKYKNVNSKIYEHGYIFKKWFEYKKLIDKKLLITSNVVTGADGFTCILHFNKEIYKIENELFELIKAFETKEKIYESFHQKKSRLSYISVIKYFGQGKTCEEIAKEYGFKNTKSVQNKLTEIKTIMGIDFYDDFGALDGIRAENATRIFYNKYRKYIDELC